MKMWGKKWESSEVEGGYKLSCFYDDETNDG